MKPISIYPFRSYRAYLQAYVDDQETSWGVLTRLAKAAGCHRPYLTKVLDDEAHLTSSHLYSLALYWKMTEPESEYLLRLLEIEKATQSEYKEYLVTKNEELRQREEKLSQVVVRKTLQPEAKDLVYHSSWIWSAIHILTSIPQFQTVKAISEKLHLPQTQVESVLAQLKEWGSVHFERGKWKFASNEHHVPGDSPIVHFHHSNWRLQALAESQLQNPNSLHYTVVQSLSREDYQRVRQLVLELIERAAKIARPSKEELMYCFTCDLFEV